MSLDAIDTRISSATPGIDTDIANRAAGAAATPTAIDAAVQATRTGSVVEQGAALRTLDAATGNAHLSDALARGDVDPATVETAAAEPSPETCTVEVRFKPVIGPTNHAFIVTTDGNSTNFFRGGPQANEAGANSSSPSSSGGVGERPVPYDPQFGVYGPIVTDRGAYAPGTVDWTTEPSGRQTVAQLPGNCDRIEGEFSRHVDDIEAARINYMPLSANSNSTVRETLERAGFDNVSPVVWAPAWGSQLPDPR